jgi:transposase
MYLKKSTLRKTGRTHLSIVHGFRDEKGVTRTKTIKTIGYLDDLKKDYDDPIAHFTELAADMEAKRKKQAEPIGFKISRSQKLKAKDANRKNLGFCALSGIYYELGLYQLLANRQRKYSFEFSLNAALRLLVFERILHPGSKRRAHGNKGRYFEKFDVSLDDLYRSLSVLSDLSDDIQAHLNAKITELYGRDGSLVYYDVTNYYFEIDEPDDLRKKGVSKEHRPDPIVQMGLLMDQNSLPVSFDVFAGNTLDCLTLLPTLKKVKERFGLGRIVIVADKGLNTSDNIAGNLAKGDGYVFSQSVRRATAEMKGWVTDSAGYRTSGSEESGFKIKSRIATRMLHIENEEGKKRDFEITERQVAFYSPKYDARAKHDRAQAVTKAKDLAKHPAKYDRATSYGASKYVKGIEYDKKTGEIIASGRKLVFDEAKLAQEEALDGYYVIATSEVEKTDSEILDIYRGLWRIEESFKITKSSLVARPVFVSTEEHIKAHFLTCFIALTIMRILEMKTERRHSANALIDTLKKASGSHIEDNWYLFDHYDDVLDDIGRALDIDFTKKILRAGDIRKLVGRTKK